MYRKSPNGWLKHFDFMLIDLICLELSFVAGAYIRHGDGSIFSNNLYKSMFLILFFLQVSVVFFSESLKNVLKRGYFLEFVATLKQTILVIALLALYLFLMQEGASYSRIVLSWTAFLYFTSSYITRLLWKENLNRRGIREEGKRSLVIISSSASQDEGIQNIKEHNYERFRMAGVVFLDQDMEGRTVNGIPVVANRDNVLEYIRREWVDEVLVDLPEEEKMYDALIHKLVEMGVTVHVRMTKLTDIGPGKQFVERMGPYTVLTTSINAATPVQLFVKRMLDICGGLFGCILTGIIFVFVAPAIYLASPGPIFFAQERVGKNGKRFKLYKFRSMYMDAEKRKAELMAQNRVADGRMFKLDYDPRIIGSEKGPGKGIGNFIRRTSLDEFPQFWNVLKGDMSLVGTRPPLVEEWENYELHHRARLAIKPGITGMWQVSGRSEITDFEEVVKLDTKYIENWSIGLDIRLLLKTVAVVLERKGSM